MKSFFQDLFDYNNHFNEKIIAVMNENPQRVTEKCIKLISHILNVHRVWNHKIQAGENPYKPWDLHPIQELAAINKKNYEESGIILDTFDLNQDIQYALSTGQTFNNNVRDILFQIINHSTYHRGQIATEFKLSGIEPLLTDYIFYKMK